MTPLVTNEGYPLWILILIIVGLSAVILLLCCAFCAFLINEKRRYLLIVFLKHFIVLNRNRKLIESKSEFSGKI